jgi:hypothetical protein
VGAVRRLPVPRGVAGMTVQTELFATDTAEGLLQKRIADLEGSIQAARAAEQSERERREAAEMSRDQWATIAGARGVDAAQAGSLCDPQLAVDQAYAANARTARRLREVEQSLLVERQRVEALARVVYVLPKLPAAPAKLHPDTVRTLAWLYSDAGTYAAGCTGLNRGVSPEVVAEVQRIATDWRLLELRSLAHDQRPTEETRELPA